MIRDKIKSDSVIALKNHDSKKVEALRYLISIIDKRELQLPPGTMDDKEVVAVLRKELKNKEEAREMFVKANRNDLVEQQDFEIEIVKEYLPQEMDENELKTIIDQVIKEKGLNFGAIMKEVMIRVEGRVGGDVISKLVKEKISGQQ